MSTEDPRPADSMTELGEGWSLPCTQCGAAGSYHFGDRAQGTKLLWSSSFRCAQCGMAYEADDDGPMPDKLRNREIARFGRWSIYVDAGSPLVVMKVAREVLGLDMRDAASLKASLPGPLWPGTHGEAARMKYALGAAGVDCHIASLDEGLIADACSRARASATENAAPDLVVFPEHARRFFDGLACELEHAPNDSGFTDPRGGVANRLAFVARYENVLDGAEGEHAARLISATREALLYARGHDAFDSEALASILEAVSAWRGARVPAPMHVRTPPKYVERADVRCPFCDASPGTFRLLAGALVCPTCSLSFGDP